MLVPNHNLEPNKNFKLQTNLLLDKKWELPVGVSLLPLQPQGLFEYHVQ